MKSGRSGWVETDGVVVVVVGFEIGKVFKLSGS